MRRRKEPQGKFHSTYRGLSIHSDPYFTYAAYSPHGTRLAHGHTLAKCREDADKYLDRLSPNHRLWSSG